MRITNENEKTTEDWMNSAGEQLKSTDDLIIYCYFFLYVCLRSFETHALRHSFQQIAVSKMLVNKRDMKVLK